MAQVTEPDRGSGVRGAIRRALRSPALLLFLGVFCLYMGNAKGYIDSGDAQGRFAVANRIWHDQSIFLAADDPWIQNSGIRAFTPDGQGISFYSLGQSITMLPGVIVADLASHLISEPRREEFRYLAAQFFFTVLTLPFLAALGVVCFYILARRLGLEEKYALWASAALAFGTYYGAYAKTVGMNVEICLLYLGALVVYTGGPRTALRVAATSTLLGLTFHYRQEFLIPVVLGLIALAVQARRDSELTTRWCFNILWPCFVLGCLALLHNYVRSGNVMEPFPGFYGLYQDGEISDALAGSTPVAENTYLFGRWPLEFLPVGLFGFHKGIFWFSPVLFALALGVVYRSRAWTRSLTLGAIPFAGYLAFIGSLNWLDSEGGWGPRYLLPSISFFVLAGAYWLRPIARSSSGRVLLASAVLVGASLQVFISFEGNNHLLAQVAEATRQFEGEPTSWQRSLIAARLRNAGWSYDDPAFTEVWSSPEVGALASKSSDQLWWTKLAMKSGSPVVRNGLAAVGVCVLLAGLLFLLRAALLRPRGANERATETPWSVPLGSVEAVARG